MVFLASSRTCVSNIKIIVLTNSIQISCRIGSSHVNGPLSHSTLVTGRCIHVKIIFDTQLSHLIWHICVEVIAIQSSYAATIQCQENQGFGTVVSMVLSWDYDELIPNWMPVKNTQGSMQKPTLTEFLFARACSGPCTTLGTCRADYEPMATNYACSWIVSTNPCK